MRIKASSLTVNNSPSIKALKLFAGTDIYDFVYNFIGIHPLNANDDMSIFEEMVAQNLNKISGIGEIGLDPTYYEQEKNTKEMQERVFYKMLDIAEEYDKPVSVHSRNSLDEILNILPSYNLKSVCLHWFDGTLHQLEKSLNMGLYISYGPSLVYSRRKQNLLKLTNERKLLIETDGPVRYPSCFKDVITLPSSCLLSIVRSISDTLGISPNYVMDLLEKNSISFFD